MLTPIPALPAPVLASASRSLATSAWLISLALGAGGCARSVSVDGDAGSSFGSGSGGAGNGGSGGGGNGGLNVGGGNGTAPPLGVQCSAQTKCNDFPSAPIIDPMHAPSGNPSQLFGAPGSGSMSGGPCIHEPQDGTLFPRNWLRPRVLFTASAGQNVYEIRFHSDVEQNDLVAYTTSTQWVLDNTLTGGQTIWGALTAKHVMIPIKVTVRAVPAGGGQVTVSAPATFLIAPAEARGALIYWTTASFASSSSNTTLQGFQVGDEGTTTALTADQVEQPVRAQSLDGGNLMPAQFNHVYCIGCHTATPDGAYVAFTSQWPWANAVATVATDAGQAVGSAPLWLGTGAVSNMSPNINGYYAPPKVAQVMMGIQTFSPAHYQMGDRIVVGAIGAAWNQTLDQINQNSPGSATGVVSELAWFDLEDQGGPPVGMPGMWQSGNNQSPLPLATNCNNPGCAQTATPTTGWGILPRRGDSNSAGAPSWSHNVDKNTDVIAYASTDVGTKDGRMDCSSPGTPCKSDVYIVPYNNKMGGTAVPLPGASDPGANEYYPAWSSDDQLIAFNRVSAGTSMYNEPKAEVNVIAYSGGNGQNKPTRINGNDPPMCSGLVSPGVQNTWPKWAPAAETGPGGEIYYWVTFSSKRHPKALGKQQLYVAGVVFHPDTKTITSYSAIYLWNQSYEVNNLIPSWQDFKIAHGTMKPPE